jgi:hypothetical protein
MDEDILKRAGVYAAKRGGLLTGDLGFGIHGRVFVLECNSDYGASALKVFENPEPYFRECAAYERLMEFGVVEICGFSVPQFIAKDERLLAVEMTIVKPPFVLDFAGAYLDWPPTFSDEIWDERFSKWADEFGPDWPKVQTILNELEEFEIHMLDPSPSNIRFR